jgi:hypothetical protein
VTEFDICNALIDTYAVFDPRRWIVVPNVSWGWNLDYEADVIAVSKSMWATEVEIKTSRQDLVRDRLKKKHGPDRRFGIDKRIRRFWYAVTTELVETALNPGLVKPEFGIIEVYDLGGGLGRKSRVIRRARNRDARKVTEAELCKLMHLGMMRYWDFRKTTRNEKQSQ